MSTSGRPVLVVLQARLGSTRLPAKALLEVGGLPLVVLAARRAARTGLPTVVATSTEPDDDVVASAAGNAGVAVVRGPLEDCLARFVLAARDLPDHAVVVRLTGDNPVPDADLVTTLVQALTDSPHGYVRIGGAGGTVPYGVAGEAFTAAALRAADVAGTEPGDREHVTPAIRRACGDQVLDVDVPSDWARLRCTVDTLDDYVRVARLFGTVPDPVGTPWRELAAALAVQEPPRAAPVSDGNVLGQSRVVLGTVQLGLGYGAANTTGLPGPAAARDILRAAAETGVTHVDTARAYGASEARIGQAGAAGLAEHLAVVTKVRPLDDLPADAAPGWCRAEVRASVAESLAALRTDRVDALLVHRAEDWWRGDGAVRDALSGLRDGGRCRLVGASIARPDELLPLLDDPELGYVQLPFNVLDHRWLRPDVLTALARRPEVVVTCRSVFLQGLLVGADRARWPRVDGVDGPAIASALEKLRADLDRRSVADLCVAYVLGQPWVTSVVLGAETVQQTRESAALAGTVPLTADEAEHVRRSLPTAPDALLDPAEWT